MSLSRPTLAACLILVAGCADLQSGEPWRPVERAPEKRESSPIAQPDVDAPPTIRASNGPELTGPELRLPSPTECSEPALIEPADLEQAVLGGPIVEEVYGADGCVDERWVRDWNGEALMHEFYDFFDPTVGQNSYVRPARYSQHWEYDHRGRTVRTTRATDIDEEPTYVEELRYEGEHLVERVRTGFQLSPDPPQTVSRETWRYDPGGRLVEHLTYHEGELISRVRHVFDTAGNEVETWRGQRQTEWLQVRNEYSDQGHWIESHIFEPGGVETQTVLYDRREDGTLREKVELHHQNGWRSVWTYDAEEREVLFTQDDDRNGAVDYRRERSYDDRGNEVLERTGYDFVDGRARRGRETRRRFDARSRIVEQVEDPAWHDGPMMVREWSYDADGTTVSIEFRDDNQTVDPHSVERRTTDGRLLWSRADADRDGTLERVTVQTWRGDQLEQRTIDVDGDGVADQTLRNEFDRFDQLVERRHDVDGDGVVDVRRAWARSAVTPTE